MRSLGMASGSSLSAAVTSSSLSLISRLNAALSTSALVLSTGAGEAMVVGLYAARKGESRREGEVRQIGRGS